MPSQSGSAHNSLLDLPNPYLSLTASQGPGDRDDEGDSARLASTSMTRGRSHPQFSPPTSPTPKPRVSRGFPGLRASILAESSSDDEGPSQSLMIDGEGPTPKSHSPVRGGIALPPGPFRNRLGSASSSTESGASPRQHATEMLDAPDMPPSGSSEGHASTSTSEPPTAKPGVGWKVHVPDTQRSSARPERQRSRSAGKARSPSESPVAGPSRTRRHGKNKYQSVPSADTRDTYQGPDLKKAGLDGYNKALWKWVNVTDLDSFLQRVYLYYEGKGLWCIVLKRVLKLLTRFFVIGFSTFLTSCIDYRKLAHSVSGPNDFGRLDDALIPKCLTRGSFWHMLFIVLVVLVYVFELAAFVASLPALLDMYRFYTYLLGVPDADIQTMPWPEIVRLIGDIKKHNPVTSLSNGGALASMMEDRAAAAESPKLDAHDIANRILRQDNYLTALYSRDLLDLRVRFPLPKSVENLVPPSLVTGSSGRLPRTRDDQRQYLTFGGSTLTKALELNLNYCVMGCLFDQRGQVKKEVIRERNRKAIVEDLRRRFIFMGLVNAILAPFIVVWVLIYSFFRYFDEYHKNPSSIGSRKYTRYAEWKFREFNELPHLLDRRLKQSYPTAKEYIDQFPKERTSLIVRFVAFIAGSFAAVLLVASLIDPDLFLHFEITPHRTVLFYIGVFGSILAIARGMVPEENLVFDPEYLMRELVRFTHYLPPEWKGKLHSQKVHADFGQLFQMKVVIFAQELLSVILTPFILWFSLPDCSGAIIDFFREFTVHVEGIGYVCSFAVFDFERPGAVGAEGAAAAAAAATTEGAPPSPIIRLRGRLPLSDNTHAAPAPGGFYDNKMEQSFLHFKATHPDWQPADPSASVFLDRLMQDQGPQHHGRLTSPMHAGGRGLGLGLMSASKPHVSPGVDERGPGSRWFQTAELATMDEDDGAEDDGEAEAMGWNRRIVESDENEGADRGLLRDAGILLNQVMNR